MSSIADHYENLLADHYSWLFGGVRQKVEENKQFFQTHEITPRGNRIAVDLGCGSGFQSLALAQSGFHVLAVDLSPKLLAELAAHTTGLDIKTVHDDLLRFPFHLKEPMELCVCMGDTLTHLDSLESASRLFRSVSENLAPGGTFILTFRDYSFELKELDRFIPVRSEPRKIFTCYLEYEPEHVKVHDLVYEQIDTTWVFNKSFYRKIRVPLKWATEELQKAKLQIQLATVEKGLITILAVRQE